MRIAACGNVIAAMQMDVACCSMDNVEFPMDVAACPSVIAAMHMDVAECYSGIAEFPMDIAACSMDNAAMHMIHGACPCVQEAMQMVWSGQRWSFHCVATR